MQRFPKFCKITALSILVVFSGLLIASPVLAEPLGLEGSYWGKRLDRKNILDFGQQLLPETDSIINSILEALKLEQISNNISEANGNNDNKTLSGNFQGRLDLPNTPLSVRGAAVLSEEVINIVPMISYDLPITNNANVYTGAGYSFVKTNTHPTGNHDSVVLTTGVETAVGKNMIVYGDAKFGLNWRNNSDNSPVKLQIGAGYRF